jgi:hypothetical protein
MMSRSDPGHSDSMVEEARDLAVKAAGRLSRAAATRIEKEGKLTDSQRVRDIVFEELRQRQRTAPVGGGLPN